MSRYLIKVALCVFFLAFALVSLLPLQDQDFTEYVLNKAETNKEEWKAIIEEAQVRVNEGSSPTVFVALREVAKDREIDITERFFPSIEVDASIKAGDTRNQAVLHHLLHQSRGKLQLGLDLRGGASFGFALGKRTDDSNMSAMEAQYLRKQDVGQAIEILRKRVDANGVAEPIIRPIGEDRIEVQLPGISMRDDPTLIETLSAPALLTFHKVHPSIPTGAIDEVAPIGYYYVPFKEREMGGLFLSRQPAMLGKHVRSSHAVQGELGQWRVLLNFTPEGGDLFYKLTKELADEAAATGRRSLLAIVVDDELISAPGVDKPISSSAEITGSFTAREAQELAGNLNNPLSVPLVLTDVYEVGPSMADDAIQASKMAVISALILISVFMVIYYGLAGVVATISVLVTLLLLLATLSAFGATLTFPSIAAMVLTAGMALDANILIFERIREELKIGKRLSSALVEGHNKVFSTIMDANVTSLIAALVMVVFGTGPVKGFGVTLAVGIIFTVFGALVVAKLLLELLVDKLKVKRLFAIAFLGNSNIRFFALRRVMFFGAWIAIVIGMFVVFFKGEESLGVDFLGGDEISVAFNQRVDTKAIETAASELGIRSVQATYASKLGSTDEILRISTAYGDAEPLLAQLQATYPDAGLELLDARRVGPSVGEELTYNAMLSLAVALGGILLYIALRFEIGYGIAAVVGLISDILLTVVICVVLDFQFSAPMVAAILMVVGYSLNDTIVAFDRIREELALHPGKTLRDIIDLSLNRVLGRTILTGLTTLFASVMLYVFGRGVVTDFSFVFTIGVIVGTFSTYYIAAPIFYWFHKGDRRHVESRHESRPTYEWEASSGGRSSKGS
jgi:SecD/SecF fusion protein